MPNRWAACALFALAAQSVWAADLDEARRLVENDQIERAIPEYRGWLESNRESRDYTLVSLELASIMVELADIRDLLRQALTAPTISREERHTVLVHLADVSVQLGELASAQRYYRDASFALPGQKDFHSLLDSAELSFELGEYRNAEAQARGIVETGQNEMLIADAQVLLSRVYYATDRERKALELLTGASGSPRTDIGPDGLYWLNRLALLVNEPAIAAKALDELKLAYPDSLETSLALGDIKRLPTPSALLEAVIGTREVDTAEDHAEGARLEATDADDASLSGSESDGVDSVDISEAQQPTQSVSIQTGSFSVRENADFAAEDLKAEGFPAAVEERRVNGTRYYRVVVPNVAEDTVGAMVLELKERGFEGFPIYHRQTEDQVE